MKQAGTSVMRNHCRKKHDGVEQQFGMTVRDYIRNDPTKRQISEAVRIKNCPPEKRMNERSEWNYVLMPRINIET